MNLPFIHNDAVTVIVASNKTKLLQVHVSGMIYPIKGRKVCFESATLQICAYEYILGTLDAGRREECPNAPTHGRYGHSTRRNDAALQGGEVSLFT